MVFDKPVVKMMNEKKKSKKDTGKALKKYADFTFK